jgi:hypothetical protein
MSKKIDINNLLLSVVGVIIGLCLVLMLVNQTNVMSLLTLGPKTENFQNPELPELNADLDGKSNEELQSMVGNLKDRLVKFGYMPDMSDYIRKTELNPDSGKCTFDRAEDKDQYVAKSSVPAPGPRIDLSQYVKKTAIPPEKVCPPQKEIDYSAYVKKSSLPPEQKCPPCIAPKVQVSAGLCKKCPPCPVCPPPKRCPEPKCPEPKPCPEPRPCPVPEPCPNQKPCPAPQPCPTLKQKTCSEIKYIKVPTVITKVIKVDATGKVVSKEIKTDSPNVPKTEDVMPVVEEESYKLPERPRPKKKVMKQTEPTKKTCNLAALNSNFNQYGVYGYNL